MYDLLQLFELGPSVKREEKKEIKAFAIPLYAVYVMYSIKRDSASCHSMFHATANYYFSLKNSISLCFFTKN